MEDVKRNRVRLSLAAFMYEICNESFMSDSDFDKLALIVDKSKNKKTDRKDLDKFFKNNFSPETGMWIRQHPDFSNGKLESLYKYLFINKGA